MWTAGRDRHDEMTYSLKELTADCGTTPKRTPVKGTLDSNVYRQVWEGLVKWIESQFLIRKARVHRLDPLSPDSETCSPSTLSTSHISPSRAN